MIYQFYQFEEKCNKKIQGKLMTAIWYMIRFVLNIYAPIFYMMNEIPEAVRSCGEIVDKDVVISITSFPKRIHRLPLIMESIYRQTIKPTKIVLWLADEQFQDKCYVNKLFRKFINRGLEIRYCEDIKSHKKYYFSLKEFPSSLIVTLDDDIFYSEYMLEELLYKYKEHPNCIIAHRAHLMKFNERGDLAPYSKWDILARKSGLPSMYLFPTTGAGCIIFKEAFIDSVLDKELLKTLSFNADDIWLKCMSVLKGVEVIIVKTDYPEIIDLIGTKSDGLAKINVVNGNNDIQIKKITEHFNINWGKYRDI